MVPTSEDMNPIVDNWFSTGRAAAIAHGICARPAKRTVVEKVNFSRPLELNGAKKTMQTVQVDP